MDASGTTTQEATEIRLAGLSGPSLGLPTAIHLELLLQRGIGFMLAPLLYVAVAVWMRMGRGYQIRRIASVRRQFRKLTRESRGPLLICANHLTLIDSFLIIWGLNSLGSYLVDFRTFPWNFPEKRNFYGKFLLRLLCYLGQCIPVVRQGPRDGTRTLLLKMKYLLMRKNTLMIFPEGTRSRSGKIDPESCTYSIGQLLVECPSASVLCVYLRGDAQERYSNFPKRNDTFAVDMELLRPRSSRAGLRAAREMSQQVISKLVEMEARYFETHKSR